MSNGADHLNNVAWFMDRLLLMYTNAEQERGKLALKSGASRYPLGSVFLTNRGRELDELRTELEHRLSGTPV